MVTHSPLLPFSTAKERILEQAKKINYQKTESVTLFNAVNRIVASTITSPMNVPSFNNSAMDGYVIRQLDIDNKNDLKSTIRLPIAGKIFAGDSNTIKWPQHSTLRIMTGAEVPNEAYAVIMQENVTIHHENDTNYIEFDLKKIQAKQNIRYVGENIQQGEQLFSIGEKLTIPKLVTLATLGLSDVIVFKPLKVAIFSTGNELTKLGDPLKNSSSIYDSNRFTIHQLLLALGCEVIDLGIIPDDLEKISATLIQASNSADIVITSGGVSVGDADYTKIALEKIGKINFWKIAMKPGKPFAFGEIGKALFCGLPGNPVSTLVTFYQFVRPLIFSLYKQSSHIKTYQVKTDSDLKKTVGRMDFQRGYLSMNEKGEWRVTSTGDQNSHITSSFNQANCFILLEQERGSVAKDETVTIELFDPYML